MDLIGKTFGQYRMVRLLGRGGMGEVYEAEHRVLQRRYALKLLPEDFATRVEAVRRFEREAAVMGNLDHAHIVRVDDFGETEGRYWLRMELVHGVEASQPGAAVCITLGDYAAQRSGKIDQVEFAAILKQILEGLAYAHGKGVVHRDLKPGNILLEHDAAGNLRVKISDFGLARVIGEDFIRSQAQVSVSRSLGDAKTLGVQKSLGDEATLSEGTSTRALLGTWEYMSPEQRLGEEVDARSDVYAVGLMCFRLLTGKELGVRLPSQVDKTLNLAWDEFVAKALEQEASGRYAHGAEMLTAFAAMESMTGSCRGDATQTKIGNRQLAIGNGPPESAIVNRKSKMPLVAVAIVALIVACVAGWYLGVRVPAQKRQSELARVEAAAHAASDAKEKSQLEAEAARLRTEREKQAAAAQAAQALAVQQAADTKAKADAEALRLANARGGLLVNTVPSGATVTLGGEDVQTTPATFKNAKLGRYPLRISLTGYEPVSREAEIKENEFNDLGNLELVRQTGTVKLASTPSGAVVKQGDQQLGKTPLELAAVPTGDATYTLALSGYKTTTLSGSVKNKETLPLAVTLIKQPYPIMDAPWANSLGMKFVPVPGTKVLFGVWDVRVQDYRAYANASGGVDNSWQSPGFAQSDTHPVVKVSWQDAQAFCAWLTQQERAANKISGSQSYRLPTDAQWSVAVGLNEPIKGTPGDKDGQIKDMYPWGTQWPPPSGAGNYDPSLGVDNFEYTSPVGSFAANPFGLYDLGGNVWQWCEDEYSNASGNRVLRGAAWNAISPDGLLSSNRNLYTSDVRYKFLGFRVVLSDASSQ